MIALHVTFFCSEAVVSRMKYDNERNKLLIKKCTFHQNEQSDTCLCMQIQIETEMKLLSEIVSRA